MRTNRLRMSLVLACLFVAAWLPRVAGLDSAVTADERKWLARSANFAYALHAGDLVATYQHEHPGVTTMWTGAAGLWQTYPEYANEAPGYFGWDVEAIEPWLRANAPYTPLELLDAGRWWVTLVVALAIVAAYLPLRRLLGQWPAVLALLFIAWMPWSVALTRQLHPDSYLAAFTFLAIIYFLAWLHGGRCRRDLVVSGVALGLACLTKAPAGFLVSIGLFLVTAHYWISYHQGGAARRASSPCAMLGGFVLWLAVAVATFVLLWPALWVSPIGTLAQMLGSLTEYLAGHTNTDFFLGQIVDDPGPLFYPVAYLLRATPATLLGLGAALVAAWRRAQPFDDVKARRTIGALAVYALIFGFLITLPGKKFDRYLLPTFWGLEVVSAAGWYALIAVTYRRVAQPDVATAGVPAHRRPLAAVFVAGALTVCGLVGLHGGLTALHYPYYLTYFNPLLGGSWTAPQLTMVGWGEGMDQVAKWINAQPNAATARTIAWYADGPLSYYLDGQAIPVLAGSRMPWIDTDYVVLYQNQIQRRLPTETAVRYLLTHPPAYVASFRGIELARVYDMQAIMAEAARRAIPMERTVLLGHRWSGLPLISSSTGVRAELGTVFPIQLSIHGSVEENLRISLRLFGPDQALLAQRDVDLAMEIATGMFVPPDADTGEYTLKAMIYKEKTWDPIPSTRGEWEVDVSKIAVVAFPEMKTITTTHTDFGAQ